MFIPPYSRGAKKRDRDVRYKTATNSAPRWCKCGRKLYNLQYGVPPHHGYWCDVNKRWFRKHDDTSGNVWFTPPCACGSILIWSYPNVWRQSHTLEMMRTNEIVPDRFTPRERRQSPQRRGPQKV